MLHTNGCFGLLVTKDIGLQQMLLNLLCILPYQFFMISGATLIDYRERYSTKTFMKRE